MIKIREQLNCHIVIIIIIIDNNTNNNLKKSVDKNDKK